ncbi:hypothetical protein CK203_052743 [Vitis vinifera]|uniref:Uncharacterized protein n=1 Tax=Vitis vinifera TaxID=29760 RepID=A0A438FUW2_VITVI|nr:hypothetical protein CK203_052743 [Vitis vinifera]
MSLFREVVVEISREGSALWHQVILSIYGSHSNGWDVNNIVRWSHRCPWKAIALVFQEFSKFTRFMVEDLEGLIRSLDRLHISLRFQIRDPGPYLLQFVWNSQVPSKSSPLSGWWLTRRSPFPPLFFDDGVVAQIISISKDRLGFPKEHL